MGYWRMTFLLELITGYISWSVAGSVTTRLDIRWLTDHNGKVIESIKWIEVYSFYFDKPTVMVATLSQNVVEVKKWILCLTALRMRSFSKD